MQMPPVVPPGSVALYPSGSTGGEGQKKSLKFFALFFFPRGLAIPNVSTSWFPRCTRERYHMKRSIWCVWLWSAYGSSVLLIYSQWLSGKRWQNKQMKKKNLSTAAIKKKKKLTHFHHFETASFQLKSAVLLLPIPAFHFLLLLSLSKAELI